MIKINLNNKLVICGLFLIILGIAISFIPMVQTTKKLMQETIKVEEYIEETSVSNKDTIYPLNGTNFEQKNALAIKYSMILEIPKISLKKGLYDVDSKYNNVKYNIQIINGSSMPDIENSRLILAGHNGNSRISYFRNLDKLEDNDIVYVYYNGSKYEYIIKEHYILEKKGSIEIKKSNITSLVLTTCVANQNKQLVYVAYLNNIINY